MKRRCSPSWARLIAKVYQADPLVCRDCGGALKIIGYLHDPGAIRQILDHLGLAPPEDERPPPVAPPVARLGVVLPEHNDAGRKALERIVVVVQRQADLLQVV